MPIVTDRWVTSAGFRSTHEDSFRSLPAATSQSDRPKKINLWQWTPHRTLNHWLPTRLFRATVLKNTSDNLSNICFLPSEIYHGWSWHSAHVSTRIASLPPAQSDHSDWGYPPDRHLNTENKFVEFRQVKKKAVEYAPYIQTVQFKDTTYDRASQFIRSLIRFHIHSLLLQI